MLKNKVPHINGINMDSASRSTNIYQNMYKDTSRRLSGIWHVIFIWKGSVFKLMWHDILVFTVLYFLLALLYRVVLFNHPVAREVFELVCIYAGKFSALIPISFLTGFYVSQVVTRWWDQFMSLPWPDKIALRLVSYCPGKVGDDCLGWKKATSASYVLKISLLRHLLAKVAAVCFHHKSSALITLIMTFKSGKVVITTTTHGNIHTY